VRHCLCNAYNMTPEHQPFDLHATSRPTPHPLPTPPLSPPPVVSSPAFPRMPLSRLSVSGPHWVVRSVCGSLEVGRSSTLTRTTHTGSIHSPLCPPLQAGPTHTLSTLDVRGCDLGKPGAAKIMSEVGRRA
jgi:hypothetical protein